MVPQSLGSVLTISLASRALEDSQKDWKKGLFVWQRSAKGQNSLVLLEVLRRTQHTGEELDELES